MVGDLRRLAGTREVAAQADDTGRFDAVIHNAGIGYTAARRRETADGLERHFAVNVLAPYLLTALITRPDRLVYLSSGMHRAADANLDDPQWTRRRWSGSGAYSDTKLLDVVLAFAVARRWPDVRSNAVDPGWVATRMGGRGAPETWPRARTQVWLATSDDPAANVTGALLLSPAGPRAARRHRARRPAGPAARLLRRADRHAAAVRIVCVGLSTVDLVYRVDRVPGVDEKAQATSVEVAAGGPAANAAVTAAALGAEVTLVSAVGAHPLGDLIRDDLGRHGVRLIDAAAGTAGPPPVSSIIVLAGTGQRTIVSRNAGDVAVGVPPDLDLAGADAVLVDGHHPALARGRRARGAAAGGRRGQLAAGVRGASAARGRGGLFGGVPAAARRAAGRVPHVAVTDGPRPVRWRSGDRSGEVPVPPVTAVDTAGAGDVFHGALAVAIARDPEITDLPRALRYAVTVAGARVAHQGPRSWLAGLSASGRGRSPGPSSGR